MVDGADDGRGLSGDDATNRELVGPVWQESFNHASSSGVCHSSWYVCACIFFPFLIPLLFNSTAFLRIISAGHKEFVESRLKN